MNDRFRFRAWSKEEKEYYYDAEKTYDYLNGIMSGSFGELLEDDNFIVEQCTGIRDKNGVLIYEGDLVQWVFEKVVEKHGVVKWCNSNGTFGGSWVAVEQLDGEGGYCFGNHWEIYGNVHETEIEK